MKYKGVPCFKLSSWLNNKKQLTDAINKLGGTVYDDLDEATPQFTHFITDLPNNNLWTNALFALLQRHG